MLLFLVTLIMLMVLSDYVDDGQDARMLLLMLTTMLTTLRMTKLDKKTDDDTAGSIYMPGARLLAETHQR
jgi:hypothetical protein